MQQSVSTNVQKQKNHWPIMKKVVVSLTVVASLFLIACAEENDDDTVTAASKVTVTNEEVGFSLLNSVEADENGNIFISPTSALIAMLMVYNGTDGDTKEEIEQALRLEDLTEEEINEATKTLLTWLQHNDEGLEVTVANSLWLNDQFSFLHEFEKKMTDYFAAEVTEIDITDHAAADQINQWVKKETKDLIDEIVEAPLSSDLVAYLINALYFNGTWTYEFDENNTYEDVFDTGDGEIDLSYMVLDEELSYFETDEFQAVKLPYHDGEMSMQLFLPKQSESIDHLIENMTTDTWSRWQKDFQAEVEGTVHLPKFKLEYDTLLNEPLQQLGIKQAFKQGQANFSRMVEGTPPLHISEVKQKTAIEVDEKGTEATAATSVSIEMTSAPLEDERFVMDINRPFFFAIYDEEIEHALFLGVVKEPMINE